MAVITSVICPVCTESVRLNEMHECKALGELTAQGRTLQQSPVIEEQHVYYHNGNDGPRVTLKLEKNTKGYNWEASISGAKTVEEAMTLLTDANEKLRAAYGSEPTKPGI